jgi:lipoprotein NlpI
MTVLHEAHRCIEEVTYALSSHGVTPQLLFERGHAHKQVGHLAAAIDDLSRVITHPLADANLRGRAHHLLAVCHRRTGNLAAALASANVAVELDPSNASLMAHRDEVRSMFGLHPDDLDDLPKI